MVDVEKISQQPPIIKPLVIEQHFDRFGMAGMVSVGRLRDLAAGVAHSGLEDAWQLANQLLHAPETSAGQHRPLSRHDFFYLPKCRAKARAPPRGDHTSIIGQAAGRSLPATSGARPRRGVGHLD